ncbi:MAG: preprotein translocase subunit SecY [Kiritimatiellae bacterium]|nr:preprotein translocase subunit SecY [Kiritimatiellia bacterium]
MIETLRNAWRIPELRKKILYTLFMLLIYRLAGVIPVAGIDTAAVAETMENFTLLQFMSAMTGNQFSQMTIMAMGITPYINASIIMQLLTVAVPYLENLNKSGDEGRKKIAQYTRYATVALGFLQAVGLVIGMGAMKAETYGSGFITSCVIGLSMAGGTALAMWIGEKITENGIGNGISLLIFAGIISSLFNWCVGGIGQLIATPTVLAFVAAVLIIAAILVMVTATTFVDMGERRVPVMYAKKVVGRKMYGGQTTNLPIKLNMSGVMPIIFANSIVALPSTIALLFPTPAEGSFWANVLNFLGYNSWFYALMFFILIIAFAYFYTAISFNPIEVANNLKKNGGFIPGIRPGKPTSDYIIKVLNRITFIGAIFLGFIAVFPLVVNICTGSMLGSIAFGGSSMLIVIGVALETYRELEAQMTMRHYKGFIE